MGTSSTRFVYCNNQLLQENINEMISVDTDGDHIIDGYIRYFYISLSRIKRKRMHTKLN